MLKKFLIFNFIFSIFLLKVNAETFYGNYYVLNDLTYYDENLRDIYKKEKTKYYNTYEIGNNKKESTDIYTLNGNNIIENDYIFLDTYYKREKLVLKDYLQADSLDINPIDFIEYASGSVFVNCKLKENYSCFFKLKDIEVNKDIIINNNLLSNKVLTVDENNIKKSKKINFKIIIKIALYIILILFLLIKRKRKKSIVENV